MDKLAKARGLDIRAEPKTAIDYTIPLSESGGVIKITNNAGRKIQTIEVSQQQGQYILDTRSYKPGVYYYTITSGELQPSGKLIVQ